jgi:glycosyltransferase involved in cell wall biosynthesis
MLRGIELHYGRVLPNNRMVVANGRCTHRFRAVPKEPFVLTSGRLWDEAKNASAIARIAARLPWPVYMAGEERLSGALPARFDGCRMLGRLGPNELAAWFGRTSIYALPARYEPFGLSALEAALSGCALVVGDIPSLREVWEDAAIFVPPDDSDRLESVLRELIADQELRERMARRAESRAQAFNPERMAHGYLEAYRTAIANRRELCVS